MGRFFERPIGFAGRAGALSFLERAWRIDGPAASGNRAVDRPPFLRDLRTETALWQSEWPAIERSQVLSEIVTVLSLPEKRSIFLTGDPGVGKTALMYEVVRRAVDKKIPATDELQLLLLDIPLLLKSSNESPLMPGELENRLKSLDTYASGLIKGAVIFMDEIGRLFELPGIGGLKITDHLKASLARGLILFGAATEKEYRGIIERDPALERRINKIEIPAMKASSAMAVLRVRNADRERRYTDQAGGKTVRVPEAVIKEAVRLADRYFQSRPLPDSALTVIERSCSMCVNRRTAIRLEMEEAVEQIRIQFEVALRAVRDNEAGDLVEAKKELVQLATRYYRRSEQLRLLESEAEIRIAREDLLEGVAALTKIPVAKLGEDEREKLLGLEKALERRVIGQQAAKSALANAIRRARTLPRPGTPYGVFVFAGPTGVGKTEIAKALAEILFGSEDALHRWDMGEFRQGHMAARLIGAPPGYIGFDQGGELTKTVRETPYCVVLLDEFEKAHEDIGKTLLSVFGEGRLTDSKDGKTTDFSNVLFILTSNLAAREIQEAIRNITNPDERQRIRKSMFEEAVRKTFLPEFVGRLTDTVHFDPLTDTDLPPILKIKLAKVEKQIREKGYRLDVSPAVRARILAEGYDPELGARPLERALDRILVSPLATTLLQDAIPPRSVISADLDENGNVTFRTGGEIPPEEFVMPATDGRIGASVYRLLSLIDIRAGEGKVEVTREEMEDLLSPKEEKAKEALTTAVTAGLMPTGSVILKNNDGRQKDPVVLSFAKTLAGLARIGDFRPGTGEALSDFAHVISAVAKEANVEADQAGRDVKISHNFDGKTITVFVRTSRIKDDSPLGKRLKTNLITPLPATEEEAQAVYRRLQRGGDMRLLRLKQRVLAAGGSVGFEEQEGQSVFFIRFRKEVALPATQPLDPALSRQPPSPPPPPPAAGYEGLDPYDGRDPYEGFGGFDPDDMMTREIGPSDLPEVPSSRLRADLDEIRRGRDFSETPRFPIKERFVRAPGAGQPPARFPQLGYSEGLTLQEAWAPRESLHARPFLEEKEYLWRQYASANEGQGMQAMVSLLVSILSYRIDQGELVFLFQQSDVERSAGKILDSVVRLESPQQVILEPKAYLRRFVDLLRYVNVLPDVPTVTMVKTIFEKLLSALKKVDPGDYASFKYQLERSLLPASSVILDPAQIILRNSVMEAIRLAK